jgi:hypothetical protein
VLFFISDKKRGAGYWGDPHFSWTCYDNLVIDFRESLRIDPGAKIDSSCRENIRAATGITAQVHPDYSALDASFLSKIYDLEEAIVRNWDCERRSRNDLALESARKNQASIQKKQGNQPSAEMHLRRHICALRISKLESTIVESMVVIHRRQFGGPQVRRSAKTSIGDA